MFIYKIRQMMYNHKHDLAFTQIRGVETMTQPSPTDEKRRDPQQGRSVQRRRRILASTAALLQTTDYAALNVGDIARHAGTSVGSIYQYFPNKDALLHALAEQYLTEMGESAEAIFKPDGGQATLTERVEQAVDWLVRYSQEHPGFHHVVKSEWVSVAMRDAVNGVFDKIHALVCVIIGQTAPQLSQRRLQIASYVVMGMMWGVLDKITHTPPDFHPELISELKRAALVYIKSVVRGD